MAIIVFNGKSYNSIEEMPAMERQAYEQTMQIFEDKNGNGVPDFLEGDMVQRLISINSMKTTVNGQDIHSLDELSPELRQRIGKALETMKVFGVIPEVPENVKQQVQSNEPVFQTAPPPPVTQNYQSAIQEESSPSIFPMVIGGIILLCFLAVAVIGGVYFFMIR